MALLSSSKLSNGSDKHQTNGVGGYESDNSSDEEPQVRMRVGDMYQASVPQWGGVVMRDEKSYHNSKEGMLIWSPDSSISEDKLDAYCQTAWEIHQYNMEQALGMLFWHKHNMKSSLEDMKNFTPVPDEWSMEDKVLFEQAYAFHGKNFRKIQQLVPDKEIGQLVKHYYAWKKTRIKTSLMDKHANKQRIDKIDDSSDESADEEQDLTTSVSAETKESEELGEDVLSKLTDKNRVIEVSVSDLDELGDPKGDAAKGVLDALDESLISLKRQVQICKQDCGLLSSSVVAISRPYNYAETTATGVDNTVSKTITTEIDHTVSETNASEIDDTVSQTTATEIDNTVSESTATEIDNTVSKTNATEIDNTVSEWTEEETQLAIKGLQKFGENYDNISSFMTSKTAIQVKNHFIDRKDMLNDAMRIYEASCNKNEEIAMDVTEESTHVASENCDANDVMEIKSNVETKSSGETSQRNDDAM